MEVIDFLGTGWKYPVTIKNNKIAVSKAEQYIKESIMIILGTAKGERVMRPDFGCGINEMVFSVIDSSASALISMNVKEALLKWEPRIEVTNVAVSPDSNENNLLNIKIEYKIKSTNTKNNLVYPFYIEAGK